MTQFWFIFCREGLRKQTEKLRLKVNHPRGRFEMKSSVCVKDRWLQSVEDSRGERSGYVPREENATSSVHDNVCF
ncbi:unnamed protein product [Anisakis simplex]|uniref:Ovule protein n=1 Tax=Anisakis simplex TaxID=6269 RepID=A0A0M3KIY9_ANISI|nr:unnamed protein product [Anisakis simplex]